MHLQDRLGDIVKIRLHQYLSRTGHFKTKAKAKQAVWDGKITIGNKIVKDISYEFNPSKREVRIGDLPLNIPTEYTYFILNKPEGVICSRINKHERFLGKKSVFELFSDCTDRKTSDSLVTVGRLDEGTTGLLIVTNDGSLVNEIANPSNNIGKTYNLRVANKITSEDISSLTEGIEIYHSDDESLTSYTTRPAKVSKISDYDVEITIYEGKKRQIRRMLEALGNRVLFLHRASIGDLYLEEYSIDPGEYVEVSRKEITGKI